MKYTKIKSNFIKERIKKTKWRNRVYIEDLIFLEQIITKRIKNLGWLGNMKLYGLKSRYKKEFGIIFKELDPKEWKKYQKKEKIEKNQEKISMIKILKKAEKEFQENKKDWIEAGGRL